MKTSLLILALNENESVSITLPQINKKWVDEIIVVDGGSTDGTIEWCKNNGYTVLEQKKPGYGRGSKKGNCVIITAATMPSNEMEYYDQKGLLDTTMTNYIGIASVLNEISRRMLKTNSGTIICLASVAGERGRQSNFIYGATKSAMITYLQGLRMKLYKFNIHVITVMPGYVDTLMSYGKVKEILSVSPNYVAKRIYNIRKSNRNVVYIPRIWWFIIKLLKMIPELIFKRLYFLVP